MAYTPLASWLFILVPPSSYSCQTTHSFPSILHPLFLWHICHLLLGFLYRSHPVPAAVKPLTSFLLYYTHCFYGIYVTCFLAFYTALTHFLQLSNQSLLSSCTTPTASMAYITLTSWLFILVSPSSYSCQTTHSFPLVLHPLFLWHIFPLTPFLYYTHCFYSIYDTCFLFLYGTHPASTTVKSVTPFLLYYTHCFYSIYDTCFLFLFALTLSLQLSNHSLHSSCTTPTLSTADMPLSVFCRGLYSCNCLPNLQRVSFIVLYCFSNFFFFLTILLNSFSR